MNHTWSFGTPLKAETAEILRKLAEERYGKGRVRICVEIMPKSIVRVVDTEENALITMENLRKAKM